ncbi:biotin carboxyl carrier domain-containing protein [Hoeflea sp. WL0058]|uniref:Biotin carboxyl carrier protein of acetyl-CoA carboxylase n=1 Tax=Flavimaribacter sediminis TaxID=2865987 RepID=A0AAE2ZGW4_9HYPH|nr:acetyl-CoA carboxylase [Flavimaribacter sediminis]MBW8636379.1 biotin carboxyl carrier domain-containing protein [Flavimaribacter sediminis]
MAKHEVKSPIPGTFYRKPAPDQPPFKEVGDTVAKGDTVAIVEVMKSFHEIKSDGDGNITAFPIDDAEPVMAGQTIVELD